MALLMYGALLVITAIFLKFISKFSREQLKLPPGPKGLPFLGNAFQIRVLRDPKEASRLSGIYGTIFMLRLGSVPFIIVNDRRAAHEALVEKGSIFASRPPPLTSSGTAMLSNFGRTINSAPHGGYWRWLRRNMASGTLASSKLHRFANARMKAVDKLISDLHVYAAAGSCCQVRRHLRFAVFSIVSYMCFGQWLEDSEISILDSLMHEALCLAAGSSPRNLLIRVLTSPWITSPFADFASRREKFIRPYIQRAREMDAEGKLDSGCYLSSLFKIQGQETGLSEMDLLVLAAEFLNAGADTTAVTLEWALACLVNHPDIQRKLFREIQGTSTEKTTKSEQPDEVQRGLPYLQAVIKETLRTHPPGFYTLPHSVTQPCKLGQYDIPQNSLLFFNLYAMANDPEVWESPSEFKPERFLGLKQQTEGTAAALNYAPFGAGRRICPGLSLAELHLELIMSRLVREFEWSSVDGKQVDMSHTFQFTILMKTPLAVILKSRI